MTPAIVVLLLVAFVAGFTTALILATISGRWDDHHTIMIVPVDEIRDVEQNFRRARMLRHGIIARNRN